MREFVMTADDARRLTELVQEIARGHTKNMDFKKVIMLQKAANDLVDTNRAYIDTYNSIMSRRQSIIDIGHQKVEDYRKELIDSHSKNGKMDEKLAQQFNDFQQNVVESVNSEIRSDVVPLVSELAKKEGALELQFTLSEDKNSAVVEAIETFSLDHTNDTKWVTRVYDILRLTQKEV